MLLQLLYMLMVAAIPMDLPGKSCTLWCLVGVVNTLSPSCAASKIGCNQISSSDISAACRLLLANMACAAQLQPALRTATLACRRRAAEAEMGQAS